MSWLAKAKAHFSKTAQPPTVKTDEKGVLTVSSVPSGRVCGISQGVSAVSSVGVAGIFENCIPAEELIEAAMRACDYWGDSPVAREQMRRECLDTPPHLRDELRQHFERSYPPEASQ